jgi:hypothetical protein
MDDAAAPSPTQVINVNRALQDTRPQKVKRATRKVTLFALVTRIPWNLPATPMVNRMTKKLINALANQITLELTANSVQMTTLSTLTAQAM